MDSNISWLFEKRVAVLEKIAFVRSAAMAKALVENEKSVQVRLEIESSWRGAENQSSA